MHDCNGFLKYTVIYYYLDNENCHDNDNCIDKDLGSGPSLLHNLIMGLHAHECDVHLEAGARRLR